MALDATVGSVSANSYVTLAEAVEYFNDRTYATLWDDYDNQESALVTASRMLDWYVKWKGVKTDEDSGMKWPRAEVVRPNGTEIAIDIIPTEVKVAVFELALSSLEGDRTLDDPLAGVDQIKAGSLMVKASGAGVDSTTKKAIPEKVKKIVSDLIVGGGLSVVRLMRA